VRTKVFIGVGLAIAVALAFLVAPEASSKPDGLEKVAIDQGFDDGARAHRLADSPTADYGVGGVDDDRLSTGLAGVLGIGVTFLAAGGLVLLVRRPARRQPSGPGGRGGRDASAPPA
jgi:cobalt/nickel transport system permease protein